MRTPGGTAMSSTNNFDDVRKLINNTFSGNPGRMDANSQRV